MATNNSEYERRRVIHGLPLVLLAIVDGLTDFLNLGHDSTRYFPVVFLEVLTKISNPVRFFFVLP